jgi:glycosyltransferase involved in cell wall biosynthesis
MDRSKPEVFFFGWPSHVGGADTKLAHLLRLLHRHCRLTLVPNDLTQLRDLHWRKICRELGVRSCLFDELPARLRGTGVSLCNGRFFTDGICRRARERGLRIVWSGEMMWHHEGELEAAREGLIDQVLYVSPLQRAALEAGHGSLPWAMVGNYIDSSLFPFRETPPAPFTIGRLSRPDPDKYPEDFPVFYEALDLVDCQFRVMAWSEQLAVKYRWHEFGPRWELLGVAQETSADFLRSLDLFIYPLGHRVVEAWGRSTVEAMLTGCVPLVPAGHHLENLIIHAETGFVCRDFLEYQQHAQELQADRGRRLNMARRCREHAAGTLCRAEEHLKLWMGLFQ